MAAQEQSGVSCEEAMAAIAKAALAMPGAWEDHPWGETVFKAANKKVFVFSSIFKEVFRCTCKLPRTGEAALSMFGFCAPTGYGLGKAGWVTASFPLGERVPLPMLLEWMEESFAAVAGERAAKGKVSAVKRAGKKMARAKAAATKSAVPPRKVSAKKPTAKKPKNKK